ncbi:MAG: hypothetical protein KDC98_07475, partial [Planctomycetes bacterium]|nr:hypothetical protein [Planctomycetota bacterium]
FRGDGRKVATGTWRRTVLVVDVETGAVESTLVGHAGTVWSVHWPRHDDSLLLSAAADGAIRLWDLDGGRSVLELLPFDAGDALAVAASDDGRWLAAAGASPAVFVWDLAYYDRHIAGNVECQLEQTDATPEATAHLREWARGVLARPR